MMTTFAVDFFKTKFGFLNIMVGKGLFFIFLGTLCLTNTTAYALTRLLFDEKLTLCFFFRRVQVAAAILCFVLGVIHILLRCKGESGGGSQEYQQLD